MRITLVQPAYPREPTADESQKTVDFVLKVTSNMCGQTDLVLLPEYVNCPSLDQEPRALDHWLAGRPPQAFLEKLADLARQGNFLLAANLLVVEDGRRFNRAHLLSPSGDIVAHYDKTHLTAGERSALRVAAGDSPVVAQFQGTRFAFATCFDIYFPEFFERLAALRPDVILFPSYQRSERSSVTRTLCAARAIDTGAYIARASYSMGEGASAGGVSLLASPEGDLLLDAAQETGAFTKDINTARKFMRSNHHGAEIMEARAIVEAHRRPVLYRPAGPCTMLNETPFPRIVAHRGASGVSPENTLPAFAIGLTQGAVEVEFDVQPSADGKAVVCHDNILDRTTTGSGPIRERRWDYIRALDAGVKFSPEWEGTRVPLLEDVFELLAGRAFMNIHVKDPGGDGFIVEQIKNLAELWGVSDQVYIAGEADVLECAINRAPGIARCCLEGQGNGGALVERAKEFKCQRLQFAHGSTTDEDIQEARRLGLVTNYFYSDDPDEAAGLLHVGVMALLTNYPGRMMASGLLEVV